MKLSTVFFNLSINVLLTDGTKRLINFDDHATINTAFRFVDKYSTNEASKAVIYNNTQRHQEYEIPANDYCFTTYASRIPNAADCSLIISKI